MNITAHFDQIITKPIWNDGKIVGREPTTLHYTFVSDTISGGFYVKAGTPTPGSLNIKIIKKEVIDCE